MSIQTDLFDFYGETIDKIPLDVNPPKLPKKLNKPSKKDEKDFVNTLMYGVTAGFVFGPGGWDDTFPEDLRTRGKMLRLAMCKKCIDETMCTQFDALAYMYSINFLAPLGTNAFHIYMYLMKEELPDKWKILVDDDKSFHQDGNIDDYEAGLLKDLRRWIFKHQIKGIKSHV